MFRNHARHGLHHSSRSFLAVAFSSEAQFPMMLQVASIATRMNYKPLCHAKSRSSMHAEG